MTAVVEKKKYAAQIKYEKKRLEEDPVFREKKNNATKKINNDRYKNDPEFRAKKNAEAKARNALVRGFYNQHK